MVDITTNDANSTAPQYDFTREVLKEPIGPLLGVRKQGTGGKSIDVADRDWLPIHNMLDNVQAAGCKGTFSPRDG